MKPLPEVTSSWVRMGRQLCLPTPASTPSHDLPAFLFAHSAQLPLRLPTLALLHGLQLLPPGSPKLHPSRPIQLPRRSPGTPESGNSGGQRAVVPPLGRELSSVGRRARCAALILTKFASPAFLMASTQWSALCPPADNA